MPAYRYITQHALTGDILTWDLPLSEVEFGPELNGPGSLKATLKPRFRHLLRTHVDPGTTLIYVERDGTLLWGGIIWRAEPSGAEYPIEASGFTSYLSRRHDVDGNLGGRGPWVRADPCQLIRDTWAYAQSLPDTGLGVTVDSATSKATIGTPAEPYRTDWWEAPTLRSAIDDATAVDGAPEWTETVSWSSGLPARRIRLGIPCLGTRRHDISFTSGVNVASTVPVVYDADEYAQVVIGLGAGEGRSRRRTVDATRDGRLRLEHVLEAHAERAVDRLAARTRAERIARQIMGEVHELSVIDHPSARLGSYQIGDDVQVRLHDEWTEVDSWCRITAIKFTPPQGENPERATLTLARPDAFTHGA
ncbi:hypothetical protein [Streptomyces luteireticuli]|uniref:hypothetical protein n=1 Tax=Streptomyces luteireticuli TaxID=173858 RepID=UPI003557C132